MGFEKKSCDDKFRCCEKFPQNMQEYKIPLKEMNFYSLLRANLPKN
jgi:hypothetical protein